MYLSILQYLLLSYLAEKHLLILFVTVNYIYGTITVFALEMSVNHFIFLGF